MAPTTTMPTQTETVTFTFTPTNDKEITCIVCGEDKCDLESTAYQTVRGLGHARVTVGKHSTCKRKDITR